ncbi:penicillin-binding protein activator LpoB [Candidatus Williamhamiltonella defendens]|uniref:Penicillin-binding protein activator LpoB n=1 Tax=Candidatus Williamhamiltonella defendens TaxID=138072 RepID=A0A2D3TB41_9ENTR|nr:penicillin-binding protein activator LpoB [Candidatus Hamiltonella defensa]ATW32999.1 penicillin-binding protein activator LpoB [Candidatus Hamiltonella defensa]AYB49089.1 penicillin-binding protein activator LpoB [Candidatus Hamiltonella defensa]
MKKYLLSASIVFLLASCAQPPAKIGRPSKSEPSTVSTDSPEGISSESAEIGIVPLTPKIKSFDWSVPMKPLVENMSQTKDLPNGSVLLVDTVKNNTNGLLQIEKATESLLHILSSNNTFFLISANQLAKAKTALGISKQDNLSSRSKAIALGRYLKAEYVLYTDVSDDIQSPVINMELMLVKTGEIIWSDNIAMTLAP